MEAMNDFKLSFFSIPPWYLGEIKTCQFWFSHSNSLPMGSSWAKKIFVKSLYGWDMALFSNFWQKPGLKWKFSHHAAIFTVCNPDQSSYTISWTLEWVLENRIALNFRHSYSLQLSAKKPKKFLFFSAELSASSKTKTQKKCQIELKFAL